MRLVPQEQAFLGADIEADQCLLPVPTRICRQLSLKFKGTSDAFNRSAGPPDSRPARNGDHLLSERFSKTHGARCIAASEFIGGTLIILGLGTRYAAALIVNFVIIATAISHRYWEFANRRDAYSRDNSTRTSQFLVGRCFYSFARQGVSRSTCFGRPGKNATAILMSATAGAVEMSASADAGRPAPQGRRAFQL